VEAHGDDEQHPEAASPRRRARLSQGCQGTARRAERGHEAKRRPAATLDIPRGVRGHHRPKPAVRLACLHQGRFRNGLWSALCPTKLVTSTPYLVGS
jgi:hypothetical protein